MLEDRIDTYDIHVYQLFESTYQENGKWYGGRREITNNLRFSVKGYSGSLESYRVKAQDVSSGKIVLIARILGNTTGNSGEVEILAIDEAPTSMEIENAGKFRTKYYVGETPDFKDIEFKLNFKSSKNPVGGLKTPAIKTDFNGEVTYNAAENGKFKVTFSYAGTKVEYTFQALEKEDLTVIEPTNTILAYKNGEIIAVPELKFNVDLDPEDENEQKETVGQNGIEGVTVKVSVCNKNGDKTDLRAEGEYSIRYDFEVTNPRFNAPEPIIITVKVTDNPYTLKITVPETGKLNSTYSGSDIEIPKPEIGKIVDTRDENREVLPDSIIYKINGKELTREEAAEPWSRLHAGSYKVEVIVTVDGKTFNAEYTMVIAKTKNSDMAVTVGTVVLGEGANFKFPVTAKFGADTVKYQYSQSREGGYTDAVPTTAGVWYVKATIAETGDYTGLEVIESFRVRENSTTAETGEGKVEGNIEGGDGIGADWKLSIKQIESETVSQVSISKQDALEGYKVELRNENNVLVKPEKAYTVNIKLSDALQGKKGLNVYFVYTDADGKVQTTKLSSKVEGEYIAVKMNNFDGKVMITTAVPGEPVGLLVSVIVLGVVAACGIGACII
ncbi:MAG: hypothetical protein K2K04_00875, partial [Clostridia bacterium]|nr:hypothetical protein [Clostridia bacterium]